MMGYMEVPESLIHCATEKPCECAIGLKNGQIFFFSKATIRGKWVFIENVSKYIQDNGMKSIFSFKKGLEILVSEIAWIAYDPFGEQTDESLSAKS
jgi:hypothetical protein